MLTVIGWIVIVVCFVVAYIGIVYPILPSMLFLLLGYIAYGVFFHFNQLHLSFWLVQVAFLLLLFFSDYFSNLIGIRKFGGSKAAIWGSTIGLLVGPFIIPIFGIIVGPFVGAVIGHLIVSKSKIIEALKVGIGSLIGFFSSVLVKVLLQTVMIIHFLYYAV